jgi:hypothetical protein
MGFSLCGLKAHSFTQAMHEPFRLPALESRLAQPAVFLRDIKGEALGWLVSVSRLKTEPEGEKEYSRRGWARGRNRKES